MRKIIHFHPNWLYANNFVNPLIEIEKKIGFETKLVTAENTPKNLLKIDFLVYKRIYNLPFSIFKLIKLIYFYRPEIVICHNSTSAILPLIIAKMLFVKHIIYFNHGLPFIGYRGILKLLLYLTEKINSVLATEIITISEQMLNILKDISPKKISLINKGSACGIELRKLIKPKIGRDQKNKIKKIINFSSKDIIILFIGRPNRRKGFNDIIKIWHENFSFNKNFKLILLGINKLDIEKITKTVPENMFPFSFVKNTDNFHAIANYLFMTSHHEGLNYSVLEAFKFGSIVISNNIPGNTELVFHKESGYLIKNNCGKFYYNSVVECEKNIKLKRTIIRNGKKIVKKYNRVNFLSHYGAFLEKL